jgi:hypothetical protein
MAALPQRTARCSSVSPSACVAALIAPTAFAVLPQGPAASGSRKAASAGAAWSPRQGSVALRVQHITVLRRPLPAHPAYVPDSTCPSGHDARCAAGQRQHPTHQWGAARRLASTAPTKRHQSPTLQRARLSKRAPRRRPAPAAGARCAQPGRPGATAAGRRRAARPRRVRAAPGPGPPAAHRRLQRVTQEHPMVGRYICTSVISICA